jgi:hypothetical protein
LCFSLLIRQRQQKQHGSSLVEAWHLQHSVSSGSGVAALAERQRQRGSGAGSAAEASAAQGQHWHHSSGGDGGGGSSVVVSSGEAGLQGGSNGGGRAVAFICTSFAVYEFIFFVIVSMNSSNLFFPTSYKWIHLFKLMNSFILWIHLILHSPRLINEFIYFYRWIHLLQFLFS